MSVLGHYTIVFPSIKMCRGNVMMSGSRPFPTATTSEITTQFWGVKGKLGEIHQEREESPDYRV